MATSRSNRFSISCPVCGKRIVSTLSFTDVVSKLNDHRDADHYETDRSRSAGDDLED